MRRSTSRRLLLRRPGPYTKAGYAVYDNTDDVSMNIRVILVFFMLLCLFSAGATGVIYLRSHHQDAVDNNQKQAQKIATALHGALSARLLEGQKPSLGIARQSAIQQLLLSEGAEQQAQAQKVLTDYCEVFGASVCFVIQPSGIMLAATARAAKSVGGDYSFRPFFINAMAGKPTTYAALGLVVRKRGLFFSAPVYDGDDRTQPIGVVGTRFSVTGLESEMIEAQGASIVISPEGRVFMASSESWLYRIIPAFSTSKEPPDEKQFGETGLGPIDLTIDGDGVVNLEGQDYLLVTQPLDELPGWRFLYMHERIGGTALLPADISRTAYFTIISLWLLISVSAVILYRSGTRDVTRRVLAEQKLQDNEERLRGWNKQLASLTKEPAIAIGELDKAFPLLTETVADKLNVERASIWWLDPDFKQMTLADLYQKTTLSHTTDAKLTASEYPAYFKALQDKRLVSADDAHTHPETQEFSKNYLTPLGITAMLDALAVVEGQPIAVLCCEHIGTPRRWAADEQNFVRTITDFVVSAVQAHTRREQQQAMTTLSSGLEQTADSILIMRPDGLVEYANKAYKQFTGRSAEQVVGKSFSDLLAEQEDPDLLDRLWSSIRAGEVFRDTLLNMDADGNEVHEEITITPIIDDNDNITAYVYSGKDITHRIRDEQHLAYLAHHCTVTGLPNRFFFRERLDHALSVAKREQHELAVLFLDLDNFKNINDTLGHEAGDELLRAVSERLSENLRDVDTAARLGGDEFIVLLEKSNEADAVRSANRLLAALRAPFQNGSSELFVSSSIGISLYPKDGVDAETLIKHADNAMYRAKHAGRDCYQLYTQDLGKVVSDRLAMENQLRRVLERDELFLEYQPLVELDTEALLGFEALLRWQHPELGRIPPAEFIPILEDSGMIFEVGDWILRTACSEASSWQNDNQRPIKLSVNISAKQFRDVALETRLKQILETSGLAPSALQMEITESIIMDDDPTIISNLKQLHELGVSMAIDDFGTGFSSLSYLKYLPVQVVKLDKCFIASVHHDRGDKAIVKSVVGLTHGLGMKVLAEGVELKEQWDTLTELNCDAVQGYLISRPMGADSIPAFLRNYPAT